MIAISSIYCIIIFVIVINTDRYWAIPVIAITTSKYSWPWQAVAGGAGEHWQGVVVGGGHGPVGGGRGHL